MSTDLAAVAEPVRELPPILVGNESPHVKRRTEHFYLSVAEMFEAWVSRRQNHHTQRTYRQSVMAFVAFMDITWPDEAWELLRITVPDVQIWRDHMVESDLAPNTINHRICSLSSFLAYMGQSAEQMRLPIQVPNAAHAQFIARESSNPRDETRALSISRARQLMELPAGDTVLDYRDRAILKFYLYTGARISEGCAVQVADFFQDENGATVTLCGKGNRRDKIGLHSRAADAIEMYLKKAELTSGFLFRPRRNSRSKRLSDSGFSSRTMHTLLNRYLAQLPEAMVEQELPDGTTHSVCVYTPHSLRATTATLLLSAGKDIKKVQELLRHKHVTTTQIYDKRRFQTSEGASHDVPL